MAPGEPALAARSEASAAQAWSRPIVAWVVLLGALVLTAAAWSRSTQALAEKGESAFDRQTQAIASAIRHRMDEYETVLRAGAALRAGPGTTDRRAWARFVGALELPTRYPGIRMLSAVERVQEGDLQRHVAAVRAEGFADYGVHPRGPRPEYFPIVYVEPLARDERVLGYDLFSEPLRRDAVERARDTGLSAVTARTQPIQDADTEAPPAFSMIYPVYRDPPAAPTADQRRAVLSGVVIADLRMADLMAGVQPQQLPGVSFTIHDDVSTDGPSLLYEDELNSTAHDAPLYQRDVHLEVGGRSWTLRFHSRPRFEASLDRGRPFRILFGGILVSGLLFSILRAQGAAERRAFALAHRMTSQLREREARLQAIVDAEPECVTVTSLDGALLEMNPAGLAMIEAERPDQVIGRRMIDLVHPNDREACGRLHDSAAAGNPGFLRFRIGGPRGELRWMEASAVPLRDGRGRVTSVLSVTRDVTQQKQAEDMPLRTIGALEAVFRAVPDLFFLLGADGTILDYRGGAERDLYVPPSEFLGRPFGAVLPAPVARLLEENLAAVRESQQPRTTEYSLRTPNGESAFEARLLPLRGDQIVVVARNISERRRAEDALRASEERYRRIVETSDEGIWTVDTDTRTTFVNTRMARLLGYEPHDMVGRPLFDFADEEGRRAAANIVPREDGGGERQEFKFLRRDGSALWATVSIKPIVDEGGTHAGALGMVTDITERKEVEDAYRQTQSLMRSIVEHSPNMIFVKDATDLRFVLFNRAGEELLGYRREEMIGKSDYDFFPKDEADFFTAKDREVLASGRLLEIPEESIQTKPKGLRILRTVKVPILGDHGRPQYLLGMSEDITNRKHLEDQLRQAQKMEAVGTLAGGIAHDFNNVLGCIIGFAELARMDCAGNPAALENVESALEAGHRAKGLVEQLLAFSRQQPLERDPLEPGPIVASAIKLMRTALPASVSIRADIAPTLPTIFADATQIHQLVMNLATNAAQAISEKGGLLDVVLEHTCVTEEQAAGILDLSAGPHVRLVVRDTGPGMDPATVERIFEPFFTTKAPSQGTGLGLSVVHGIVKSHDGAIVVRSHPGEGTTVEVYLPVHPGTPAEIAGDTKTVPQGHGEHILFVDDESPLAELGRRVLGSLGYRVTALTDPVEAVAMFRAQPDRFDLVVTDLTMPSLSGTDLARELLRIRPDVPILLNSGYGGQVTPEIARAIGLRGLLAKPNTVGTLGWAVHGALTGAT